MKRNEVIHERNYRQRQAESTASDPTALPGGVLQQEVYILWVGLLNTSCHLLYISHSPLQFWGERKTYLCLHEIFHNFKNPFISALKR